VKSEVEDAQNSTHTQNSTRERVERKQVAWWEPKKELQYGVKDVGACVERKQVAWWEPKKELQYGVKDVGACVERKQVAWWALNKARESVFRENRQHSGSPIRDCCME
jgi:hypothetical protein